jgi:hypothetical protein
MKKERVKKNSYTEEKDKFLSFLLSSAFGEQVISIIKADDTDCIKLEKIKSAYKCHVVVVDLIRTHTNE